MLGRLFGIRGHDPQGDLRAMQDLIDHANGLAQADLRLVREDMEAARAARRALARQLLPPREQLKPACAAYADVQERLLDGKDGALPLLDRVVRAQGEVNSALWLGRGAQGCVDTCSHAPAEGTPGPCAPGACRGTLRSTRQLEDVLGGPLWAQRRAEAWRACGPGPYKLRIEPPAFEPEAAEGAREEAGGTEAVKEQASPAAGLLLAPASAPAPPRRRCQARGPPCRRARAFL